MATIYEKLGSITNFQGAGIIRATLWSNNLAPIASEIHVLAFSGATLEKLEKGFGDFANRIWEDKYPKPGHYLNLNPFRWKSIYTNERAELICQKDGPIPKTEAEAARYFDSPRAQAFYFMPPWGLYGKAFSLDPYTGFLFKGLTDSGAPEGWKKAGS